MAEYCSMQNECGLRKQMLEHYGEKDIDGFCKKYGSTEFESMDLTDFYRLSGEKLRKGKFDFCIYLLSIKIIRAKRGE